MPTTSAAVACPPCTLAATRSRSSYMFVIRSRFSRRVSSAPVLVEEVGAGSGPVQGDLPEVADARRELLADQVEQREVGQGRAVGVVACSNTGRSVSLPSSPSSTSWRLRSRHEPTA